MTGMGSAIWSAITEALQEFIKVLASLFGSIGDIFFTTTTSEAGTVYTPTILGYLMFVALAAGLVWLAIAVIRKLIRGSVR